MNELKVNVTPWRTWTGAVGKGRYTANPSATRR